MKAFLILSFALYSELLFAQGGGYSGRGRGGQAAGANPQSADGKISGKVVDAKALALEYATITLFAQGNPTPINGTVTDNKGNFTIPNVRVGSYSIKVSFLGYGEKKLDNLVITDKQPTLALGTITLAEASTTTETVTVTADRPLIENKIDKMVYNVEKDVSSQGGVATDVLRKVPMVSVDVDGNVELQGNANIRFLINGKPSSIFGNNLSEALQAIPASQIKSIEVVTTPGAKYDAEGTGGIINIILKDNKVQGIHGDITLSPSTRRQNGSLNLSARTGNFGINAYANGNALVNTTTNTTSDNEYFYTKDNLPQSSIIQNGTSKLHRAGFQTGLSMDWEINKKNNITASFGYTNFQFRTEGNLQKQFTGYKDTIPQLIDSSLANQRYSYNNSRNESYDWSLLYKKTFSREKQELDILYNASYGNNHSNYSAYQYYTDPAIPFQGNNGTNPGTDRENDISIDYTHPVNERFLIETGAKVTLRDIVSNSNVNTFDSTANTFLFDPKQSFILNYTRNIYAYYLSSTFSLFDYLDVKAGLRYEYTTTQISTTNNPEQPALPDNSFLAPSLVISHNFAGNQTLKVAYNHRIQRPSYNSLNTFINLSDPYNVTTGNANLKPEITDKIELTYTKLFSKGSNINVTTFFQYTSQNQTSISRDTTLLENGKLVPNVLFTTPENIGEEERGGLSLFGSVPLGKKITLRSNILMFDRYLSSSYNGGTTINSFEYRINFNFAYQITESLIAEAFGNFNSPRTVLQGKVPSFTFYNLAIRKEFLHKKASISLTATNPFNHVTNLKTELTGSNFTTTSNRQVVFQSFGISFNYKFGKLEFKPRREGRGNSDSATDDTPPANPVGQ